MSRTRIATLVAAACAAGLAGWLLLGSATSASDVRVKERGTTDHVSSQSRSTDTATPTTRPTKLPALIKAKGKCWDQLNTFRDFMDANPYGAELAADRTKDVSTLLGDLYDTKSTCDSKTAEEFVSQEVQPWLLWTQSVPS